VALCKSLAMFLVMYDISEAVSIVGGGVC